MRKNRSLGVLILLMIGCLFIPHARAYWLWSPSTDSQYMTQESVETQEPEKKQVEEAQPVSVVQKVVEKVTKHKFIEPEGKAVQKTEAQKKTESHFASLGNRISQGTAWFWSPTQGKFIHTGAGGDVQRTAEGQYQHALKLREAGKEKEATRELKNLVRQYPQSVYAPEAQFLIARLFEDKGSPIRAAAEFQKLIREFPRSERIDEAMEHLFKIGNLFLSGEKQRVMGVAIIPVRSKAVDVFRFIVEEAPYGSYGDQAQLRLGMAYRKIGNFEEAIKAFETLIANYPTSSLVDEAHYQLAETSYDLSQNTIRDQRTLHQAATHLKEFIKGYGATTLAQRARILKQQLDEQDAEKNYRIGLYYEKEGFIESALIYYEDVASRYAQTVFGHKAAERFQALNQPTLVRAKGEEEIERRLTEVRSMLQALGKEERKKDSKTGAVSETAPLRGQLEAELASLTLAQKQFQEETEEKFRSRRRALRERERNLREKFKIFERRKKSLRDNQSPELEEIFQKWNQSLVKEQGELAKERKTLGALGLEFKREETSWLSWISYFGLTQPPSEDRVIEFREKKWDKLEQEKGRLASERQAHEKQLADLATELVQLNQKEFEIAKAMPLFQELLPDNLEKNEETLGQKRGQLDESIRLFEDAKKEYRARYGDEFLKTLATSTGAKTLQDINQLITSGGDLEKALQDLQKEKASLSETWLDQKEKLNTMVKAFAQVHTVNPVKVEEVSDLFESADPEEQAKAARILKKRMKYLEREIRSRLDQIQDWERENARRMEQLDQLLHPKSAPPRAGQAVSKAIGPAKGTYKLARAFLFGLPHRDRELMEEAKEKMAQAPGQFTSEQLKTIRELQEEIELQSILIQGRAEEVSEFTNRLDEFRKQAKQVPGFTYQSMLVDRFPSSTSQSLSSARELLGEQNQEAVFVDRVNRETRELENLERALVEIDQRIEVHGMAIERSKRPSMVSSGIATSLAGDAETLPTAINGAPENGERQELESKLVRMRAEIDEADRQYQKESTQFEQALFEWYRVEAREKLLPTFSSEGKTVVDQKERLSEKQDELRGVLTGVVQEERQVAQLQREFLDKKLAEFEKRLGKFKDPSDSLRDILTEEIKRTAEVRDSLIREVSFLESLLKK